MMTQLFDQIVTRITQQAQYLASSAAVRACAEILAEEANERLQVPMNGTKRAMTHVTQEYRISSLTAYGIIKKINKTGLLEADMPARPVIWPRPSLLPTSVERTQNLAQLLALEERFAQTYLRNDPESKIILLGSALKLVVRLGCGEDVAVGILARITRRDLQSDGTVSVPADAHQIEVGRYSLPCPPALYRLLNRQAGRVGRRRPAHRLFHDIVCPQIPKGPATDQEAEEILTETRRHVKAYYDEFVFPLRTKEEDKRIKLSWTQFATLGPASRTIYSEIPSFWVSLLASYPLPTDVRDINLLVENSNTGTTDRHVIARRGPTDGNRPKDIKLASPGLALSAFDKAIPNWNIRGANLIARVVRVCQDHISKRGHVRPSGRPTVKRRIDHLLEEADRLAPSTSIVHAALARIMHGWAAGVA